jgi:fimbrial isopeptide formation D2 family protein/LPXTG-motif cell wall-anchored protein
MVGGAAEPTIEAPYLSWSVSPAAAGATFEIEWRQRTRWLLWWGSWSQWGDAAVVDDCSGQPCPSTGDLDGDRAEFQVTHVGAGHRIQTDTSSVEYQYQVRPLAAPPGHAWTDTEWRQSGQSDRIGNVHDLGSFELGVNQPASCIAGAFYSVTGSGAVNVVARGSGTPTSFGQFTGVPATAQINGLGIGFGGTVMYAAERPSGSANGAQAIHRYSVANGWERFPVALTASNVNVVTGAVSLADGRYYFGGFRTSNGATRFELFSYDHTTRQTQARGTVVVSSSDSNNGDIAFNLNGDLFLAQNTGTGTRLYTVPAAALAAGGTMTTTSSPSFTGVSSVNGIAFAEDGTVFIGNGTTVRVYDPSTSTLRSDSVTTALASSSDLASCASPATLTIRKDVVARVAATDQFTMSMLRGSTVIGTATTSGSAVGVQATQVGPLNALAGQTYTIQETISANAGSYASSYSCVDERGATVATGASRSGSVTVPNRGGANVVCTFRNAPLVTTVSIQKLVESLSDGSQTPARDWEMTARTTGSGGTVTSTPSADTQKTDSAGIARWSLKYASTSARATIAVAETPQRGYEFAEGACRIEGISGAAEEVPLQGSGSTTLADVAPGSTVECTYVNRELPTTLTLANAIGFGDTGLASEWMLRGTGPQGALPGPVGASGTAAATASVTPGVAYALASTGGRAAYEQVGSWDCRDQLGTAVTVTASGVTVVKGTQVTCTVTHSTARMTLLKHIDTSNGGTLRAAMFTLTATPASFTGLSATSVQGNEAEIATGSSTNRFDVRPGHGYALTEKSDYASLGLRLERQTGPDTWVAVTNPTVQVPAGEHHVYRFVNAPVPALALPLTGGIGSDTYAMAGGALLLLALAFILFRSRRSARREPGLSKSSTTTPSTNLLIAHIQRGIAAMATTKKGLSARIAAGFGAAAIATVTILGGALPASAAVNNIDQNPVGGRSLTIHKFAEPATPTTMAHDGSRLTETQLEGLTALVDVPFSIQRVEGIDLNTTAGWAAADGLTVAEVNADYTLAPARSGLTAADGSLTFANLDAAVYLVTENSSTAHDIAFTADPFLVSVPIALNNEWLYNVHVYPKNGVTGIEKAFTNGLATGLGDRASWNLTVDVPEVAAGKSLSSFVISDTLDARLRYDSATVTGTNVSLLPADYTVAASGQALSVTFTPAGLTKLAAANDASLSIAITTTVTSLAGTAPAQPGVIANQATLTVNGTQFPSNTVTTQWGSLAILTYEQRTDATDKTGVLAGAKYRVYATEADAIAGTNPITIDDQVDWVSGQDGIAFLPVLPQGTYYVVETQAPAGYRADPTPRRQATIQTGDLERTTIDAEYAKQQVPAYALPITGGSGQAAFMIGGAGLILGGLGFVLLRRRKAQAANQA